MNLLLIITMKAKVLEKQPSGAIQKKDQTNALETVDSLNSSCAACGIQWDEVFAIMPTTLDQIVSNHFETNYFCTQLDV